MEKSQEALNKQLETFQQEEQQEQRSWGFTTGSENSVGAGVGKPKE